MFVFEPAPADEQRIAVVETNMGHALIIDTEAVGASGILDDGVWSVNRDLYVIATDIFAPDADIVVGG